MTGATYGAGNAIFFVIPDFVFFEELMISPIHYTCICIMDFPVSGLYVYGLMTGLSQDYMYTD